jgi:hypothetical protein
LVIGFIEHLQNVTTNNYDSLTELHALKFTVTTAHIKSSQFSPAVAWLRLLTTGVPLPLRSRTVSGLGYLSLITVTLKQVEFEVKVIRGSRDDPPSKESYRLS